MSLSSWRIAVVDNGILYNAQSAETVVDNNELIRHVNAMDHCSMNFKVHKAFEGELCSFVMRKGAVLVAMDESGGVSRSDAAADTCCGEHDVVQTEVAWCHQCNRDIGKLYIEVG